MRRRDFDFEEPVVPASICHECTGNPVGDVIALCGKHSDEAIRSALTSWLTGFHRHANPHLNIPKEAPSGK